MKPFAVTAAQGKSTNPLRVKRLPADGKFRLLCIKVSVFLGENPMTSSSRRCVLAIPFFALGDVELETVCSWEVQRRASHRNTHLLISVPNVAAYLSGFVIKR